MYVDEFIGTDLGVSTSSIIRSNQVYAVRPAVVIKEESIANPDYMDLGDYNGKFDLSKTNLKWEYDGKYTYVTFGSYPYQSIADKASDQIKNADYENEYSIATVDGNRYKRIPGWAADYLEFRPIRWRVLSADKNGYLLLADEILESKVFSDGINFNNNAKWCTSSLYDFLNNEFYNVAFSDDEKKYIAEIAHKAMNNLEKYMVEDDSYYYTEEGMKDRVFLLSAEDIFNQSYGFEQPYTWYGNTLFSRSLLIANSTPYARGGGAIRWGLGYRSSWWLRTTTRNMSEMAQYVNEYGEFVPEGYIKTGGSDFLVMGVRPAIYLKIKKSSNSPIR